MADPRPPAEAEPPPVELPDDADVEGDPAVREGEAGEGV